MVAATVCAVVGLSSLAAVGQDPTTTEATTTTAATSQTSDTQPTTVTEPTTESTETTAAPSTTAAGSETSATSDPATTSTTLDAESSREKARAVANLNLAKAADVEIAASLQAINDEANATIEKIEAATTRIEVAQGIAARAADNLEESGDKQAEIEAALMVKAVEGFKTRSIGGSDGMLTEATVNEAIRQNQLLDEASSSTTELLEELRGLLEDRRLASEEAARAERDALAAEQELQAELAILKEQQGDQLALKAEAERRIDQWAGELTAYAREDAAIQTLIGQNAAPAPVTNAINSPTTPSLQGFQWPIEANVTSEYGYRIHPVYKTRRLHAGIDLGAARGVPIASSNDGVVIFAGVQGGYGRTVIVDHGGGITTLYAHMSEIGSTQGQAVARGDIIGFVGASGTATGNHLHFEVRVNGGPVNPRNYMP